MDRGPGSSGGARTSCRPTEGRGAEGESNAHCQFNGHSIGAMDVGDKASAHIGGGVLVDVAAREGHRAAIDVHASSLRRQAGKVIASSGAMDVGGKASSRT